MTENEKLDLILDRLEKLDADVKDIKLILENEIRSNFMQLVQEHVSLYRKLDDTLQIDNEKGMPGIRVRMLENEVRCIKMRLESTT